MSKPAVSPPRLSLFVQYAVPAPSLPRWRLRRWVQFALEDGLHTRRKPEQSAVTGAQLTLRLCDEDEARALNRQFRERDYATNVLTFEYGADAGGTIHADIVICLALLEREARLQAKPMLDHAAHLVVHGVLHALGYDHQDEQEAKSMEALERHTLARLGIKDPYHIQAESRSL